MQFEVFRAEVFQFEVFRAEVFQFEVFRTEVFEAAGLGLFEDEIPKRRHIVVLLSVVHPGKHLPHRRRQSLLGNPEERECSGSMARSERNPFGQFISQPKIK